MRCQVCGRQQRFHKMACWTLRKAGKQSINLQLHRHSRCRAVVVFQDAMIAGVGGLHKIRNCKDCQPILDGAKALGAV